MLVALVANANVININTGTQDALRKAVANASTGDVIVMAAGTYVESNSNYISFESKDVTVVEALADIMAAGGAAPLPNMMMIKAEFAARGVPVLTETRVTEIKADGVTVTDKDGQVSDLPADTVVNALGMRSNKEVVEKFAYLIPEVYVIGDAAQVGNMRHATASAFIPAVEC